MVSSQDFNPMAFKFGSKFGAESGSASYSISGSVSGRIPAQWEPHAATLMAYPFDDALWFGKLASVRAEYDQLLLEILKGEDVTLVIPPADESAESATRNAPWAGHARLKFVRQQLNDVWLRDSGPIIVKHAQEKIGLDFIFNAWGEKFDFANDDKLAARLCEGLGIERLRLPFVFEGGSIDVNGVGSALTTEQCLLEPQRNPAYSKHEIDAALRDVFGLSSLVWLGRGLEGDHTDGHIDTIARFIGVDTVACHYADDRSHPSFFALNENLKQLEDLAAKGNSAVKNVVAIPIPKRVDSFNGDFVPYSYVNFYFCNAGLIVPQFADDNDGRVLEILQKHLPGQKVIGLNARNIVLGGGVFNCLTQQVPV
jgi:agmatine deiminase